MRKGALETPSVQSVDRVLTILEAVAKSAHPVPLAKLTELLGINQSSVFRLANTLKRRGFQVAAASEANYSWTFLSLASTLNFDYLPALLEGARGLLMEGTGDPTREDGTPIVQRPEPGARQF